MNRNKTIAALALILSVPLATTADPATATAEGMHCTVIIKKGTYMWTTLPNGTRVWTPAPHDISECRL